MNASLKTTSLIGAIALCAAALTVGLGTARAADEGKDSEVASPSRAELLAEVVIWRESGLADAQSGDASDPSSPGYVDALARYHEMRGAPRFAQLVQRIQQQRGEKVLMASPR